MASASDIAQVRRNTDEPTTDTYSDQVVSDYIDEVGVAGASARIWEEKGAQWASLVTVKEADASHNFSDLSNNADDKAKYWHSQETAPASGPIVHTIERRT